MRGIGGSTLRGGQTVFHGIRMWGQLFRAAMFLAAFATVAAPAWTLWHRTSGAEWYAAGMVTLAEAKLALGYDPDSGQELSFADGTRRVLRIRDIAASVPARAARERIRDEMFASAGTGATAGAGMIVLFLVAFWFRGAQLGRQRRIRGAEMVTAGQLRRRVRPAHLRALDRMPGAKRLRPYRIAGVPYPERTETQHTIVSGTTGSGKTVLISDLVAQIREKGERCVLYDKMGSYTRSFFDAGPRRADEPAGRESAALVAVPGGAQPPRLRHDGRGADPPAEGHGRSVLGDGGAPALRQRRRGAAGQGGHGKPGPGRPSPQDRPDGARRGHGRDGGAVDRRSREPEDGAFRARHADRQPLGARVPARREGAPFSIREWISDEDRDGFPVPHVKRGDQHASLRGLISTWLEIAVNAMLSLAQDDGRRIWVILDELPTLHQVPSLQPGLAESRQFGGCFVLGVQVASALRDLYGRNGAETISGLCGTRAVLAAPDRDTAQWSADSLGRAEVEDVAEGWSATAPTRSATGCR